MPIDGVNYATSTELDNGWTRISLPFYTHSTGGYTVSICCESVGGVSYIDDV